MIILLLFRCTLQRLGINCVILDILKSNIPFSNGYEKDINKLGYTLQKDLFINARVLANAVRDKKWYSLEEVEFQVYSQFGEDGILQWLIHNIDIESKTFIEFGVEDYSETNTRFLLLNDNWSGLVMDGSEENIKQLNSWEDLWRYDLKTVAPFITRDNINQLIA